MPAKSPADQLKEWNQALAADQSQSADLAAEIDRLKNQIADLTKTVSDIDQKKQQWDKSAQAAEQQDADFTAYIKTKTKMLEATVADPKAVEDAKDAALKGLADLQAALDKANAAAAQKQQDWSKAKSDSAAAAAAYNAYAGLAASNDAALKDLASLRAAADKEGAANNVARMYFLVLVMADVLKKLDLPDGDAYVAKLNDLASAAASAGQGEKLAKIAADKAAVDATQAQKTLDAARAKWRQNVLDSIPNGGGAPAAAPAGPVAAPAPALAHP